MPYVRDIAAEIIEREGGFVNDPDDPGGATNYGVTIHTMRRLGLDLDRDGDVDINDVRSLTVDQAINIFLKQYFERPGLHRLPYPLQASVFDMNVNAGSNSIRILQRLLNEMGFACDVDGRLGPQTLGAIEQAWGRGAEHFVDAYGIARRNYYFRIADRRPASRKYVRTRAGTKGGWIKRAEEFISPKYHMNEQEFQERIAKWA